MKRRNFIKSILGAAAAVALPACKFPTVRTESASIAPGGRGSVKTENVFKYSPGDMYFISYDEGGIKISNIDTADVWGTPSRDAFDYSSVQNELNKITSARVDNMKLANNPRFLKDLARFKTESQKTINRSIAKAIDKRAHDDFFMPAHKNSWLMRSLDPADV